MDDSKRLLNELYKTVSKMTPKQSFYVIFYSDTAYPMFHPRPARALIPATPKNKQYLFRWLMTVPLCLRTKGEKAVQIAFALNPDVIYILGDGAFNDRTVKLLTEPGQNKIAVHTLGMEVKSKDAEGFQAIAKKNGGTYHDVGVSPVARQLASQHPRPRNKTRGPVWGITLPE